MVGQIWNTGWGSAMREPRVKRWVVRRGYEYLATLDREGKFKLMNYGYDNGLQIPLETYEESNRYPLQLYHHVAGQVDLSELNVLEVGCGRGGGAAYVMRTMWPRTYIGVDIAKRNIAFCRKHFRAPGLHFRLGDAENLEFGPERFDVVINIESSSQYGDVGRFFGEVQRVLRPGGYFLYADIRRADGIDELYEHLEQAGLVLLAAEDIGAQVFRALDKDNTQREEFIRALTPKLLYNALAEFAGTRGSEKYKEFRSGKLVYLCCLLEKEPILSLKHTHSAGLTAGAQETVTGVLPEMVGVAA